MVDLILAETDEKWEAVRDDTVRKLVEMDEPAVFKAYQKKWDEAAAVIVPMVREIQIKNGVDPYTPEQYADYGNGAKQKLLIIEDDAKDSGAGSEEVSQTTEEEH